jgi:glycosyltransferase involved in cell wall biosynthesis
MSDKLTVLIPALNNAGSIVTLLNDVKWADEILVVDSFSADDTMRLCSELGARVIQHRYENSAKQKNWAIPQCSHPWVLLIDTDERLSTAMQEEIQSILKKGIPEGVDAYRVARQTMFLGRWMKVMNLWPDYQTRLFRKSVGRYEEKEVHADVRVPGRVATLTTSLIHNATPTLSKQINLLDRYSTYQALELRKQGRYFRSFDLIVRPVGAFVYLYVLRLGFTEGIRGLFIAFHTMAFSFFTYAKLWEHEMSEGPTNVIDTALTPSEPASRQPSTTTAHDRK